jgi:hypothetical protein
MKRSAKPCGVQLPAEPLNYSSKRELVRLLSGFAMEHYVPQTNPLRAVRILTTRRGPPQGPKPLQKLNALTNPINAKSILHFGCMSYANSKHERLIKF